MLRSIVFLVVIFLWVPPLTADETSGVEKPPNKESSETAAPVTIHKKPALRKTSEADPSRKTKQQYVDLNRDGVNDLFQDANGDGINDVTDQTYPHRFKFADQNKDGINDLFVDRDGDGVNDLSAHYMDLNGDGICDNVVDYDGDGINDITGVKYTHRSLEGYRYGRMDEEQGTEHHPFIDEDGDGMNDPRGTGHQGMHPADGMDVFIDEDGDGICDGRTFLGREPGRSMPGMQGQDRQPMGPARGHMGPGNGDSETGGKKHRMGGGK